MIPIKLERLRSCSNSLLLDYIQVHTRDLFAFIFWRPACRNLSMKKLFSEPKMLRKNIFLIHFLIIWKLFLSFKHLFLHGNKFESQKYDLWPLTSVPPYQYAVIICPQDEPGFITKCVILSMSSIPHCYGDRL